MKAITKFEQYREFRKTRALQKANKKAAALELKQRKSEKGRKSFIKCKHFELD